MDHINIELEKVTSTEFVRDFVKNFSLENSAKEKIFLYGEKENEYAENLIPDTEHFLSENYLKKIKELL